MPPELAPFFSSRRFTSSKLIISLQASLLDLLDASGQQEGIGLLDERPNDDRFINHSGQSYCSSPSLIPLEPSVTLKYTGLPISDNIEVRYGHPCLVRR